MTFASPTAPPLARRAHPNDSLRHWLKEGRFSLALSSGFFGFFAHVGMLSVLEDEALLPVRVSGSSAGALVAGLWAAGLSAEAMRQELFALTRAHFWDPSIPHPFAPGLLRGTLFRRRLEALLPVPDFRSTRVPLTISVFDLLTQKTRVVADGKLAPAIHASCAVPFLFRPV